MLATVVLSSLANGGIISNPDFEIASAPFPLGWTVENTVLKANGLAGSPASASLASNAAIEQDFSSAASPSQFTFAFTWRLDGIGSVTTNTSRVRIRSGGNGNLITLRLSPDGLDSYGGTWVTAVPFTPELGQDYTVTVVVGNFDGDPALEYKVSCVLPTGPATSGIIEAWHGGANVDANTTASRPFGVIRFEAGAGNTLKVDNLDLIDPNAPKVVKISGVYPHLAVTNSQSECGIGAVVPWQGDLWSITYGPHLPTGSNDKLYQIAPDLSRTIRPESVGGTPANRFIHSPSNQLIIGPHFIDAAKNVRTLRYSVAPGRYTGTAAHLTDPSNRIYMFTMENGLYDVNVHDLSFITRYPDKQGTGDEFLFGYHGKGAYSGGGRLIVANNGRPNDQDNPQGAAGVLASWDGSVLGGSSSTPNQMTGWTEHARVQHCEITGPGDIYGNSSSADPVWATGFDWKSVLLRTFENGMWTTWRLPKSSYTHDGSHGWHTEWPRIRMISPGKFLMHMHGMFYDFPATFSAADFSGLSPICSYYKMPVDYCTWEGQLVMAKNDSSKFDNALVPRAQSNFWFGQPEDLKQWGAPMGHGSLWRNEAIASGQVSEAFLVRGFASGTLHLRNAGGLPLSLEIQSSSGDNVWHAVGNITVPPNSSHWEVLNPFPGDWLRLVAGTSSPNVTATFLLANPYPHTTPASAGTDRFAALADIRDERSMTDGLIRVMTGTELKLEFASRATGQGGTTQTGYHQIGATMNLETVNDPALENATRTSAATTHDIGSDNASAWITVAGGGKLRLPRTDPLYDAPFASGWARGFREAVTERVLLNCHGTFYEIPRTNSGGVRKLQPICTHEKRITDFASWRGLLVLTGVLDSAPISESLIRSPDSKGALWLGEIDDLWRMGEPRGIGGPWLDTAVSANAPSDPYLMYGYRDKSLRLSHQSSFPVTFTVELDFLADNTWSRYAQFTVQPGETLTHQFPVGFHAHWVRVSSDAVTTATAQFTYGPTGVRDRFLDWAKAVNIPTGAGRAGVANHDADADGHPALIEYALGADGATGDSLPLAANGGQFEAIVRNGLINDRITCEVDISTDLKVWTPEPGLLLPSPDQTGVPAGFTRMRAVAPAGEGQCFFRLRVGCP